jgi:photosystem II stability/assembly factor-like uncharacterized protein
MTWRTVGSLAGHLENTQIRFADSLHGFAFSFVPDGGAPLWSTDDGGAHWNAVNTPFFADVFDLAISRGQVYVVSMQQKDSMLRIWSSPANQLHWTEDPRLIRPGAGPVISTHLVLSGNRGWLIEDDRTVVAGAQLSSSGRWLDWNPPCANAGGPALFTASSGNDLVAVCDEGVWTGPKITPAVYFSHDAGRTFQRRTAPAYGEIASPNATTAVVNANGVLRRTTDEGATWSEVGRESGTSSALDLGFTSNTQGFVIFANGQMVITYDAGATWSAVTLP